MPSAPAGWTNLRAVAQAIQVYYISRMKDKVDVKTAILDLEGADCASCAYAIEHTGRKVSGVSDVYVDINAGQARVEYAGDRSSLERITKIVRSLGYDATIRSEAVTPEDTPQQQ